MASENGQSNRILWATISALAIVCATLIGFSVSQVTARISVLEGTAQEQAALNRERESRLARLEQVANVIFPELKTQLNRI